MATVGNNLNAMSSLCGYQSGTASMGELVISHCPNHTKGRYVKVQLLKKDSLTLCDVAVFGRRV